MLSFAAKKYHTPIVYVNQVGSGDCLSFEGASRVYDADGNLKHTYEDVTVKPEQYKEKEEVLIGGTIYELQMENGVYSFVIDGTDERTYTLKIAADGDEELWNRFLEL